MIPETIEETTDGGLPCTPGSARIIENIGIAMRADTREQSLAHLEEAQREIENMEGEKARLSALYHELLLSVESVHEGESRHQTALRYIRERETFSCAPASDSSLGRTSSYGTAGDGTKIYETRTKSRSGGNRPNNGQPGCCP